MMQRTLENREKVFEAVYNKIIDRDEPKNHLQTLDNMFDSYIINDLDGRDAEFRALVLYHYRNMAKLMEELDKLL